MNTIILCEGKTDAVLLGYYLDKVCGFSYCKEKINKLLTITLNKNNEFFTWHTKGSDCLAIWGVGGKDCLIPAIDMLYNVLSKSSDEMTYHQIAIVCDRDLGEDDTAVLSKYGTFFSNAGVSLKNNEKQKGLFRDSFERERNIQTFALIIPQDRLGALETVLLESIKEDEDDKKIVENCEGFVTETRPIARKYIVSDRLEMKAKLSVVFAILSPEKVFDFIDELLKTTVKWETKEYLKGLFSNLIELVNIGDIS